MGRVHRGITSVRLCRHRVCPRVSVGMSVSSRHPGAVRDRAGPGSRCRWLRDSPVPAPSLGHGTAGSVPAPTLPSAESGGEGAFGVVCAAFPCLANATAHSRSLEAPWPRPSVRGSALEGAAMAERTSPSSGGSITPLQQMLASGTGAILTSLFGKCFLYCNGLMDHLYVCQNGNGCTAWYKAPTRFTGTLDAFVKITRYEGIRSLWSGLPPTLVMAVPATVIYFTTYDQLRDYLQARTGSRGHHIPLLAGALARLGAVTVISPLELIRTKMQSRQLSYQELRVCIQSAVAQDGWLSLWRGWGPTVLRDVPFSALYWFNYELVRDWLCRKAWLGEATFMISFTSGAISGTVAAVLTLPFDVVKTQRQIELGHSELHPVTASKPSSTWLLMQRIRAESGTRGLFAGFLPRVIKVAPACAIMISTYEFGKTFFQKLNQERRLRGL
ncbi:probable mitochondrial glutathione transporter SLC25A39 isoform X3 [Neopsephotus bourkii]|uniref:probable mitochondrial glutathione transporter SLC25A39 isoform X3 n=1 Tax=Neopsephotus bourkii TaxID=309878 RepID=UPI002AA5CB2C|nr:probable mitochondrial glutathione transporter SLC25A39 isoform X3 [Neopsephotus bourkii]